MTIEEILQVNYFLYVETTAITWFQGVGLRIIDTKVFYVVHIPIKKQTLGSPSLKKPLVNITVNYNYRIQI